MKNIMNQADFEKFCRQIADVPWVFGPYAAWAGSKIEYYRDSRENTIRLSDGLDLLRITFASAPSPKQIATARSFFGDLEARGVKIKKVKMNQFEIFNPENVILFEVAEGVGFYVKREEFQNKHNLIPVGNFLLPIEDLTTERARNIIACIARPERFTKLAAWARWSTHYPFGGLALLIKRALEQQKFETTATESAEAAEGKP